MATTAIRYRVTAYEPGRRVEFTFDPVTGLVGTHTFVVTPVGSDRATVRHVIDARTEGAMRVLHRVEVVLGTARRHLDFRAAVRRSPDRVLLTTVVQLHNARGRANFALVPALGRGRSIRWLVRRRRGARLRHRRAGRATGVPVDRAGGRRRAHLHLRL